MFNTNRLREMLETIEKHKIAFMFILAAFLTLFGCGMLTAGFIVGNGVITDSVLISAGEVFTFSGSVLGINTAYRSKLENNKV